MAAKKAAEYVRGHTVAGQTVQVPVSCAWCERCPSFNLDDPNCNPEGAGLDKK